MPTTIYLIRHGETDWNISGRWQGHADVPLNAAGRQQADLLARRLSSEQLQLAAIYSSDLSRAYETAHAVGLALGVAVQLYPMLRELDLGTWSGLTAQEVRAQYPTEWALLRAGQDIPRGGAESRDMLRKRAVTGIQALVDQHPQVALALFSHGALIDEVMRYAATPEQHAAFAEQRIGNTAITTLECDGPQWRIISYNDAVHLHAFVPADEPQPDDLRQPTEGSAA